MGMSDFSKTTLQELGRVNVQGMTIADIVAGLNDLGIDLSEARVFNITGVTLRVEHQPPGSSFAGSEASEPGRFCAVCKRFLKREYGLTLGYDSAIVSPTGMAHVQADHNEGYTACGRDATGPDWGWKT